MGNCQAIDAASLVIQHQNGKVDKMYWPISASEVMKLNPGHYVALLITTTICHTTSSSSSSSSSSSDAKTADTTTTAAPKSNNNNSSSSSSGRNSVRITRVKLLRPMDTLALGHVYRLISTQEVMKGLVAKKQAKMRKNGIELADSEGLKEAQQLVKNFQQDKHHHHHQISRHGQRTKTKSSGNGGGTTRPKTWRPSLNSISEFTS